MKRSDYGSEARLIQDIEPAHTPQIRSSDVNRSASIGDLDSVWHRQSPLAYSGLGTLPYAAQTERQQPARYSSQLRVAPLAVLDTQLYGSSSSRNLLDEARELSFWLFNALSAGATVIASWSLWQFVQNMTSKIQFRPTKYTLRQGTVTNWNTPVLQEVKRVGLPLIGGAAILLFITLLLPDVSLPIDTSHRPETPSITQAAVSDSSHDSTTDQTNNSSDQPSSDTHYSGIPINPSAIGIIIPSTPAGGYGGNTGTSPQPPSSSGSTPPNGIPGVTTPYPITIPGQTIIVDGKQVIGTSDMIVTLN